jgi:DNA-binding transcriptional regulator YiaG
MTEGVCSMAVMAKRRSTRSLTQKGIRAIRESLGLSIEQAAAKVGVKPRTWQAWEQPSQDRQPSSSHIILIRLLEEGKL